MGAAGACLAVQQAAGSLLPAGRSPSKLQAALPACGARNAAHGPAQVVLSRTFGSAAPGGGVGVRMLVPLLDLLNHSGPQSAPALQYAADGSNVR
jgi:hypothetical protein